MKSTSYLVRFRWASVGIRFVARIEMRTHEIRVHRDLEPHLNDLIITSA